MNRAVLGLCLLLLLPGCSAFEARRHPAPHAVVVARVRPGSLPDVAHLTGQVRAGRRGSVSAAVGGRVLRVEAREGERVREGEPLIWLDARQQEAQIAVEQAAVAQARARLGQLQAQFGMTERQRRSEVEKAREDVAQADLDVREAQARLETAQVDMKRKGDLLARKAVAKADYETSVLNFHLSEDELASARSKAAQAREALRLAQATARDRTVHESDLAAAQADVDGAIASLEASRAALEQMVLYAPLSGVVVARHVEPGQTLSPGGEPLLQIVDQAGSWVTAVVAQAEVARFREGMPAEIVLAQQPDRPLRARIQRLVPASDPATSTVRLNLALDAPPAGLLDGVPASIRVRVGTRQGLLVPLGALQGEGRTVHVIRVRDGSASRIPVRLLMSDGVSALLADGVAAGDLVVVEGGQLLGPGDAVQVLRTVEG